MQTYDGKQLWQKDFGFCVTWLAFSPDGQYLVGGGQENGSTSLYNVSTGEKVWHISTLSNQGAFSGEGSFITIGDLDLEFVDLYGNTLGTLRTEEGQPPAAQYGSFAYVSKDGTKVVYTRREMLSKVISVVFAKGSVRQKSAPDINGDENGTGSKNTIVLKINNPIMTVNGVQKEIDPGKGTEPVIVGGRTMLPIRALIEALGGTIGWDGSEKFTEVAPQIVNGRTMVPLRYIIENLGYDVTWDGATSSVTIKD